MEDIGMFSDLIVIPVMGICFVIGHFIRNRTKIPNDFIPTIMAIAGLVLNIVYTKQCQEQVNMMTISSGLITGLATSGFYDALKIRLRLKKKSNTKEMTEESSENTFDDSLQ